MRPIDADDLKKSLNNYVFNDPTCPLHIAATVDQYIDFAPTVGGWISCSERMPDEDSYKWAVGITSTGRCIAFQEHNAYENDTVAFQFQHIWHMGAKSLTGCRFLSCREVMKHDGESI